MSNKHPCPCCGYLTIETDPADIICDVCYREDLPSESIFPLMCGSANNIPFLQAQENFLKIGAIDHRFADSVRSASDFERDPGWRPFDKNRDIVLDYTKGENWKRCEHAVLNELCRYYWREDYFLKGL